MPIQHALPVLMAPIPGEAVALVGTGVAATFTALVAIINRLLTNYFALSETRNREAQLQLEKAEVVDENDALQKKLAARNAEIDRLQIQLDEARRGRHGA